MGLGSPNKLDLHPLSTKETRKWKERDRGEGDSIGPYWE